MYVCLSDINFLSMLLCDKLNSFVIFNRLHAINDCLSTISQRFLVIASSSLYIAIYVFIYFSIYFQYVDLTETSGAGLLGEMSVVEVNTIWKP